MGIDIKQVNHNFRRPPSSRSRTDWLIFHHSDSHDVPASTIHQWHLNRSPNWIGIGYNYVIRENGSVETGRPRDARGAHVKGQNASSIGICLTGKLEEHAPTDAQVRACVELGQYLQGVYGDLRIGGHKTFAATACPGRYFPLEDVRSAIKGGDTEMAELDWKQKQAIRKIQSLEDMGLLNKPQDHIDRIKREEGELETYVWLTLIERLADEIMHG